MTFPDWARALFVSQVDDGHGPIVDMSGLTPDEREAARRRFPLALHREEPDVWVLNTTQVRFRNFLATFAGKIPENSIVVDFASAEADFAEYFQHCRYLAMDFAAARLQRAIEVGRIRFAVVADITRSPLREGATDVIASTNTIMHVERAQRGPVVKSLGRALRPGGMLAMTILAEDAEVILNHLGPTFSIVEQRGLRGPLSRQVGERAARVFRRATSATRASLKRRLLIRVGNAITAALDRVEGLLISTHDVRWAMQWLVVRKSG